MSDKTVKAKSGLGFFLKSLLRVGAVTPHPRERARGGERDRERKRERAIDRETEPERKREGETCTPRFRAMREHLERFEGRFRESQGHNLAVAVFMRHVRSTAAHALHFEP